MADLFKFNHFSPSLVLNLILACTRCQIVENRYLRMAASVTHVNLISHNFIADNDKNLIGYRR